MRPPATAEPARPTYLLLFLALLGLSCAWVLSLPVFPSQDGPMHVYYAHILSSLLATRSGPFRSFFYVRSYVPPYCLYYYALMLLMKIAPVALAEKLMVCLLFILQAFGFRYLAGVLGETGYLAALWSLPLLLNWPLAMGFENFSLSLALALFALGLWWRMRATPRAGLLVAYLGVVLLVALAHPVPLLLVLAVTGLDLLFRALQIAGFPRSAAEDARKTVAAPPTNRPPNHQTTVFSTLRLPLAGFLASCLSIVYVLHFTDRRRIARNALDLAADRNSLRRILKLSSLGVFSGHELSTYVYRCGLYALFFLALAVAIHALRQSRMKLTAFTLESPWLSIALAGVAVTLLAPSDINGSHFFSDRLVLIPWLCALLAAAVHGRFSLRNQNLAAGLAALAVASILLMANDRIRPIALDQAALRRAPFPEPAGAAGLLLGNPLTPAQQQMLQRISYGAYDWQLAYKFEQTDTVLLNPPWLDLPILAIAQRPGDLDRTYPPAVLDSPGNMFALLAAEPPAARAPVLDRSRFLLLAGRQQALALGLLSPGAPPDAPDARWTCGASAAFFLCQRY